MIKYDFHCEYCEGTVRERTIAREPVVVRDGIVIFENAVLGVCDHCGARYYPAKLLKRAEQIASRQVAPKRTIEVPVETL